MHFWQIYSDVHDDSSLINNILQNANIIHTTKTCDIGHEMVIDIKKGQWQCHIKSC